MMTTSTETNTKAPTHTAYVVKPNNSHEKSDWYKVGAAWEHGDSSGFNLILNILGQDIMVTVRKNKPKTN
ncbi:hypothetical protein GCM10028807_59990 [Spirosoma daeguense]